MLAADGGWWRRRVEGKGVRRWRGLLVPCPQEEGPEKVSEGRHVLYLIIGFDLKF